MTEIHADLDQSYSNPRAASPPSARQPRARRAPHARRRRRRVLRPTQGPHDEPRRGRAATSRPSRGRLRARRPRCRLGRRHYLHPNEQRLALPLERARPSGAGAFSAGRWTTTWRPLSSRTRSETQPSSAAAMSPASYSTAIMPRFSVSRGTVDKFPGHLGHRPLPGPTPVHDLPLELRGARPTVVAPAPLHGLHHGHPFRCRALTALGRHGPRLNVPASHDRRRCRGVDASRPPRACGRW